MITPCPKTQLAYFSFSGPKLSPKAECSNPCEKNAEVESHFEVPIVGKLIYKCRWGDDCQVMSLASRYLFTVNLNIYSSDDESNNFVFLIQEKEAKDREGNSIPCHGNMKWRETAQLDSSKCEAPESYFHVKQGPPPGSDD